MKICFFWCVFLIIFSYFILLFIHVNISFNQFPVAAVSKRESKCDVFYFLKSNFHHLESSLSTVKNLLILSVNGSHILNKSQFCINMVLIFHSSFSTCALIVSDALHRPSQPCRCLTIMTSYYSHYKWTMLSINVTAHLIVICFQRSLCLYHVIDQACM